MLNLIAAAAFFLAIHLLVSGTRLRDALIGRIGQGPYMGGFVVASFAGLIWLGFAFAGARGQPGDDVLWDMTPATHYLQLVLQLVAMVFIVVGLATPNPTSVRQEATLDRPEVVRGMLRITRHPFLWGATVWALGHLMVNGDAVSILLFGAFVALSLFGTASIDAKRRLALGSKWDAFAAQTSNIPFLAIAQGRQRLALGEIGWWKIALGVVVWAVLGWAVLGWAHPFLFGVRAFY